MPSEQGYDIKSLRFTELNSYKGFSSVITNNYSQRFKRAFRIKGHSSGSEGQNRDLQNTKYKGVYPNSGNMNNASTN